MFFQKKINLDNFKKNIIVENINFKININFFDKKNSSANIKNQEIYFRFSKNINQKNLENHFSILLKKIEKTILKNPKKYYNKKIQNEIFFNEKNFKIINHKFKTLRYNKIGDIIFLNMELENKILENLLGKFFSKFYLEFITNYIIELNKKTYNYDIGKINLKLLNSKWGHCTKKNDILINVKLLNTERKFLDYVIIHELSHCKFKHHKKSFWNNVEKFCPNYKQIEKELKNKKINLF